MSDTQLFVQAQPFSLAGSGAVIGATSIILNSFQDIDGVNLLITNFGSKGWGTLEPDNGVKEEQISFTGVTQNANGTCTLTGVKSVLMKAPYTESTGLTKSHAGGVSFVISNTAGFYDSLSSKKNDETITGVYTFTNPNYPRMDSGTPAESNALQLVTKGYVDSRHGYWEAPVANFAALPAGVNTGEVRLALDTLLIYIWNGAAWAGFAATAAVTTMAYANGSESVGTDHRTFTAGTAWTVASNVHVFRNGVLMVQNASADYVVSTGNHIVFNYDVSDSDIITLMVIN
jgi:hypothetical protein